MISKYSDVGIKVSLIACMLFVFFFMVWGLTGDCPFKPDPDEQWVVRAALGMVFRGDLNPQWLGHPASTLNYPLCFYYHFLNAVYFHGSLSAPNCDIADTMFDNVFLLCYLPRYVNVAAIVAVVPLTYGIAKEVSGRLSGLFAIWFYAVCQLNLEYCQVLRSDALALFFSMVTIYSLIKVYREPTFRYQFLAAVSAGLAVSSRWPSLALISVFVLIHVGLFLHFKEAEWRGSVLRSASWMLALAFITFAITTPYIFLEFGIFQADMELEKAAHGLGMDGLSPPENFLYYLGKGIPEKFHQPHATLALLGIVISLVRKQFLGFVLAIYLLAVLCGTSLHPFHADKWLIPILPILSIFAGQCLSVLVVFAYEKLKLNIGESIAAATICFFSVCFVSYIDFDPTVEMCGFNLTQMSMTTEKDFYDWIFKNIPEGTPICIMGAWEAGHQHRYKLTSVMYDPSYMDSRGAYLSPFDLYSEGCRYFIWNDYQYPSYAANPRRYARENKFYNEVFANSEIIKEWMPQKIRMKGFYQVQQKGPQIRLYKFTPKHPQNQS
jgi:hypothetical protein